MQKLNQYLTKNVDQNQTLSRIKIDIYTNGIELNPEIKPYIYSQLIFNKGIKTIQWGKE